MVWLVACFFLFMSSSVQAKPLDQDDSTSAMKKRKSKEEKEAEISAAEAKEEANKDNYARVIVLRWQGTSTDQNDLSLQRNVRSAIAKTDALFLPAIDLFQDGRELQDKTLPPELQPATVSEDNIAAVMKAIGEMESLSFDEIDPNEWQAIGTNLRKYTKKIWFVDRAELREPLFLLYAQIGRVADNIESSAPPFFEYIGGRSVNYYHYLAAHLAYYDSTLLAKVSDENVKGSIQYYLELLQKGIYPSMKVDFQMEVEFNAAEFAEQYEVLINGLPVELDANGEMEIFLGRSDILLKRSDAGYGLSDSFEAVKTEEKAYRILEIARKRMEIDFVRQLFLYENECKPDVDSDILTYLSIYAKMHPDAKKQIYIAVPKTGNPNKVWVWRFDPSTTSLNLVESGKEEFPVHFVATMGTGALYSGAMVSFDEPDPAGVAEGGISSPLSLDTVTANIPFVFDFRAHYTRFMVEMGIEFGLNMSEGGWTEYYQTPGRVEDENGNKNLIGNNADIVTVLMDENCMGYRKNAAEGEAHRTGNPSDCTIYQETYHTATFSQNRYIGLGYLFGRDAAFGYGLRAGARWGFVNMPKSWATTAHLGYTHPLQMYKISKRITPVIDADLRAGTMISRPRNLSRDLGKIRGVEPIFGFTITAGSTF